MRATILAVTIGCLSTGCLASSAQSASQTQQAKERSANKALKDRQKQKASSEPKGFNSICIGCAAQ